MIWLAAGAVFLVGAAAGIGLCLYLASTIPRRLGAIFNDHPER